MNRIEISVIDNWPDPIAESVKSGAKNYFGMDVGEVRVRRVYTIDARIKDSEASRMAAEIANPVTEKWRINKSDSKDARWIARIGLRPGVTDNVGKTAKEALSDILGRRLEEDENVFSSLEYIFKSSKLKRKDLERLAQGLLANQLIETISIFSSDEIRKQGVPANLPYVKIDDKPTTNEYDLEVSDDELLKMSREGLLALTLDEMKVIRDYYRRASGREKFGLSKNATDVELEVLAQTWSEHCKHKIFSAEIDYIDEKGERRKIVSCFKSF
nr:hypothetical protein [Victivallales bacterium]